MDLINEEHIIRLKIGQDSRKVARLGDDGARRRPKARAKLFGENLRERCFTEARRTKKKNVIQRLFALTGCLDIDFEVRLGAALTDLVIKGLRAQRSVQRFTSLQLGAGKAFSVVQAESSFRPALMSADTSSSFAPCAAAAAMLSSTGVPDPIIIAHWRVISRRSD